MAQRRKFSAEFKREAVDLTRRPQASVSQVAQELGVNANVLSRWRRESAKPGKTFTGAGVPRDEELATLRRELARVKRNGIFCAMRRRSSPRSRREVRGDPAPPR